MNDLKTVSKILHVHTYTVTIPLTNASPIMHRLDVAKKNDSPSCRSFFRNDLCSCLVKITSGKYIW